MQLNPWCAIFTVKTKSVCNKLSFVTVLFRLQRTITGGKLIYCQSYLLTPLIMWQYTSFQLVSAVALSSWPIKSDQIINNFATRKLVTCQVTQPKLHVLAWVSLLHSSCCLCLSYLNLLPPSYRYIHAGEIQLPLSNCVSWTLRNWIRYVFRQDNTFRSILKIKFWSNFCNKLIFANFILMTDTKWHYKHSQLSTAAQTQLCQHELIKWMSVNETDRSGHSYRKAHSMS